MKKLIAIIILCISPIVATAGDCETYLNPEALLREKELDPSLIRYVFKKNGGEPIIQTYYDSKYVGEIMFEPEYWWQQAKAAVRFNADSGDGVAESLEINGEKMKFRGKGLGTIMYMVGAKLLHSRDILLAKSEALTSHSKAVWKRFKKRGITKKVKKVVYIDPKFIESEALDPVIEFFEARLMDKDPTYFKIGRLLELRFDPEEFSFKLKQTISLTKDRGKLKIYYKGKKIGVFRIEYFDDHFEITEELFVYNVKIDGETRTIPKQSLQRLVYLALADHVLYTQGLTLRSPKQGKELDPIWKYLKGKGLAKRKGNRLYIKPKKFRSDKIRPIRNYFQGRITETIE